MDSASPLRSVRNDNDKKGINILFLFQIGQFEIFIYLPECFISRILSPYRDDGHLSWPAVTDRLEQPTRSSDESGKFVFRKFLGNSLPI